MEIKSLSSKGLASLLEAVARQAVDIEHEEIIDKISKMTQDKLDELTGGNYLAKLFVHDIWSDMMESFKMKEIPMNEEVTAKILRIVADVFDERRRLEKELTDKRATVTKVVDKDTH